MDTVIELRDIALDRSGHRILSDIHWATAPDQHWVILGANGAGKTSLVRVATGRLAPTSGTATLMGEDLSEADPAELATRMSLVPHSLTSRLRPSMSVRDVVRTAAWGISSSFTEEYEDMDSQRADDLLVLFGVGDLADRPFSSLSEGERQRIALARGLMSDPEVLILDEPTAGLDLGARELLMQALTEMMSGPRAPQAIVVTHHLEEIPVGITHAAIMKNGTLLEQGAIGDVLTGVILSEAFELPLSVGYDNGRWWTRGMTR